MVACADETIWNKSLQPKDLRKTRTQLLLKPLWGCGERIKAWSYNDLRVQANHLIESQIFLLPRLALPEPAGQSPGFIRRLLVGLIRRLLVGLLSGLRWNLKSSCDFVETWLIGQKRPSVFEKIMKDWCCQGTTNRLQCSFSVEFSCTANEHLHTMQIMQNENKNRRKAAKRSLKPRKLLQKNPTPACLGGGSSVADDSASEPGPGGGSAASSSLSSSSTCSARRTLRTMARCLAFPVLPTVARLACSSRLREPKCVYWALVSTTSLCRNMFLWVFATSEVKSCKGHLRKKQWRNHKFKHVAGSWKSKTLTKQDGEDGDSNLSLVTPTCLQHGRLAAISQGLHHQAFGTLASTLHHLKSSVPNPRFEEVTSEPTFFAGENTWK